MMAKIHKMPAAARKTAAELPVPEVTNLWALDIGEVTGHNLEMRGREEVNRLLGEGWRLLHIYTLTYEEDGVWRERPMAILGRLRQARQTRSTRSSVALPDSTIERGNENIRPLFDMGQTEDGAKARPMHIEPQTSEDRRAGTRQDRKRTTRSKTAARDQHERIPYTLEPHPEL